MKACVLGAGQWGKAVGHLLERNGHAVEYRHHGDRAWPAGTELVALALPVQHIRESLAQLPAPGVPVLSLSKGLEIATGSRVTEIVGQVWGEGEYGTLSGPNFAAEIARNLPAAAVVAASREELAEWFQQALHQPSFRLYRSTDLVGVELGGALKNVYAVAAGICAGLKLGENAFAALVTRCLAEMTRIGVSLGGRPETFAGLSGVGDLLLTAGSIQSRNYRIGLELALGKNLETALAETGVAEGVATARSLHQMATVPASEKPVADRIHAVLFEGLPPLRAVADLQERAPVPEHRKS